MIRYLYIRNKLLHRFVIVLILSFSISTYGYSCFGGGAPSVTNMAVNTAQVCNGNGSITTTDAQGSDVDQWKWEWGDGTDTGWITNPVPQSHTYTSPGQYDVYLHGKNNDGTDKLGPVSIMVYPDACPCYGMTGSTYGCGNGDYISRVHLPGETITLNNSSQCSNNQIKSFYNNPVPDLRPGGTYTITIENAGNNEALAVWIDFNADGIFQASELIGSHGPDNSTTNSYTFTIPCNAIGGDHMMRVKLDYRGSNNMDPCAKFSYGTYGYGEIEDYLINIAKPVLTLTASKTNICPGEKVDLTAAFNMSNTVTINWNNGLGTGTNKTVYPNTTTTYTVSLTDIKGCNYTESVTVTVNPGPTKPTVSVTPSTCTAQGSAKITNYSNSNTYEFKPPGPSVGAGGVITGANYGQSYNVRVLSTSGCNSAWSDTIIIDDVKPKPPIPDVQVTPPTCTGDGSAEITNYEGTSTYEFNPTGPTVGTNGAISGATLGTSYKVRVKDQFGCLSDWSTPFVIDKQLPIPAAPTVIITPPTCKKNGSARVAKFQSGNTYEFNPVGPTIGAGGLISGINFGDSYSIRVNVNGCFSPWSAPFVVDTQVVIIPDFEADILLGCAPLDVKFTNKSVGINNVNVDCMWDFGDGGTSQNCGTTNYTYNSGGVYSVTLTLTTPVGCQVKKTIQNYIKVTSKPIASFKANPMVIELPNNKVTFINNSLYGQNYTWDFGDESPTSNLESPIHSFPDTEAGKYKVDLIVSNEANCTDTASLIITVNESLIFYIPNAFTPDGDGVNQVFKPIFSAGFDPQTYSLFIYNRWGELIFESHNTDVGWDGTYGIDSEEIVPNGMYIWKIKVKETKADKHNVYKGHVMLLR